MVHKPFGLVLVGGGARGLAHAGVLKALDHLGYRPSAIAGVSMGAVIGAAYSLNPNWYADLKAIDKTGFPVIPDFNSPNMLERLKNLVLAGRELSDLYFGWGAGQDTVDWGRAELKRLTLGKRLEDGRVPVFVTATDVLTGERVVQSSGDAVDALYASSALAGILPPFEKGEQLLVDGGYADISPTDVLRRSGVKRVISVDPSQKRNRRRPRNGLEVYLRSTEITQDALSRLQHKNADFVLTPDFVRQVGVLEYAQKRRCIAAGSLAVMAVAPDLRKLLGKPKKRRNWT